MRWRTSQIYIWILSFYSSNPNCINLVRADIKKCYGHLYSFSLLFCWLSSYFKISMSIITFMYILLLMWCYYYSQFKCITLNFCLSKMFDVPTGIIFFSHFYNVSFPQTHRKIFSVRLYKISFNTDCCYYALKPIWIIFTLVYLHVFTSSQLYGAFMTPLVLYKTSHIFHKCKSTRHSQFTIKLGTIIPSIFLLWKN